MMVWVCPLCFATLRKTTDGRKAFCPDCSSTYHIDDLETKGAMIERKISDDELRRLPRRRCPA